MLAHKDYCYLNTGCGRLRNSDCLMHVLNCFKRAFSLPASSSWFCGFVEALIEDATVQIVVIAWIVMLVFCVSVSCRVVLVDGFFLRRGIAFVMMLNLHCYGMRLSSCWWWWLCCFAILQRSYGIRLSLMANSPVRHPFLFSTGGPPKTVQSLELTLITGRILAHLWSVQSLELILITGQIL